MKQKILVIDDDVALVEILKLRLEREGFEVEIAYDGHAGLSAAYDFHPDLIILDIRLGAEDMDGWAVCTRLRELTRDVPIFMLSALDEEDHRVRGLDMGADDYLVKSAPNSPEILARVKALLRRAPRRSNAERYTRYCDDALSIDLEKGMVKYKDRVINLTGFELKLLELLVSRTGVWRHGELLRDIWNIGPDDSGKGNLKVLVRQLRGKIERNPSKPRYVMTMRSQGYYFQARKGARLE